MNSYYIVMRDLKSKELLVLARSTRDSADLHRSFQSNESLEHEFIAFHDTYETSRMMACIRASFRAVGQDSDRFSILDSECLAEELTNQVLRKQKDHAVAQTK